MTSHNNVKSSFYQIRIKGHLSEKWVQWFDEFEIVREFNQDGLPVTTLTGPVADRASLYGLIMKARDLGLTLISVIEVPAQANQIDRKE